MNQPKKIASYSFKSISNEGLKHKTYMHLYDDTSIVVYRIFFASQVLPGFMTLRRFKNVWVCKMTFPVKYETLEKMYYLALKTYDPELLKQSH